MLSSTDPEARFLCALDTTLYTPCASPFVVEGLAPGSHTLAVTSVAASGVVDATPAAFSWTVLAAPAAFALSTDAVSRWAAVLSPVRVREEPSMAARVIGRLSTRTPERTTNLVVALERLEDSAGRLWVRVRLPMLPNNSTGWVPRGALGGYTAVATRLVVETSALRATLYRRGRAVWRARIGIGTTRWPTPTGEFYVRNKLTNFRNSFYGPVAFGTSARSAVLTDWPGGGFVGIHGTNAPALLPGRVSHGCIRLRNADILRLARLMPVGTPVTIR